MDDDLDFISQVIETFRIDAPAKIEAMRHACDAGDTERVAVVAHSLKGIAGAVNAFQLHAQALRLEAATRDGETTILSGHIEDARAILERTLDAMTDSLSEID